MALIIPALYGAVLLITTWIGLDTACGPSSAEECRQRFVLMSASAQEASSGSLVWLAQFAATAQQVKDTALDRVIATCLSLRTPLPPPPVPVQVEPRIEILFVNSHKFCTGLWPLLLLFLASCMLFLLLAELSPELEVEVPLPAKLKVRASVIRYINRRSWAQRAGRMHWIFLPCSHQQAQTSGASTQTIDWHQQTGREIGVQTVDFDPSTATADAGTQTLDSPQSTTAEICMQTMECWQISPGPETATQTIEFLQPVPGVDAATQTIEFLQPVLGVDEATQTQYATAEAGTQTTEDNEPATAEIGIQTESSEVLKAEEESKVCVNCSDHSSRSTQRLVRTSLLHVSTDPAEQDDIDSEEPREQCQTTPLSPRAETITQAASALVLLPDSGGSPDYPAIFSDDDEDAPSDDEELSHAEVAIGKNSLLYLDLEIRGRPVKKIMRTLSLREFYKGLSVLRVMERNGDDWQPQPSRSPSRDGFLELQQNFDGEAALDIDASMEGALDVNIMRIASSTTNNVKFVLDDRSERATAAGPLGDGLAEEAATTDMGTMTEAVHVCHCQSFKPAPAVMQTPSTTDAATATDAPLHTALIVLESPLHARKRIVSKRQIQRLEEHYPEFDRADFETWNKQRRDRAMARVGKKRLAQVMAEQQISKEEATKVIADIKARDDAEEEAAMEMAKERQRLFTELWQERGIVRVEAMPPSLT